jgi:hypothetical protein
MPNQRKAKARYDFAFNVGATLSCCTHEHPLKISDQTEWPQELWAPLGARDNVHMSDSRVTSLGISMHLCRALDVWWSRTLGAQEEYKNHPFGSFVTRADIKANVRKMSFQYAPNNQLSEFSLSSTDLQSLWGSEGSRMSETISVEELQLERQVQVSIGLVKFPKKSGKKKCIFKGRSSHAVPRGAQRD